MKLLQNHLDRILNSWLWLCYVMLWLCYVMLWLYVMLCYGYVMLCYIKFMAMVMVMVVLNSWLFFQVAKVLPGILNWFATSLLGLPFSSSFNALYFIFKVTSRLKYNIEG